MDPCLFVRIVIGNLSLKFPSNDSQTSCYYCKIKLKSLTTQTINDITINNYNNNDDVYVSQISEQIQGCFNFKKSDFEKYVEKYKNFKIEIYKKKNPGCGFGSGKLVGVVSIGLMDCLKMVDSGNVCVVKNGWMKVDLSSKKSSCVELHLNVRVEPDPRFVFEFDGEPECSPQVFQVNGNVRQAVFTCKFSFRNSNDHRNIRSGSSISEAKNQGKLVKERKGWSITIHDLSGSPVAMASMVTPFVPSHGTYDVRRSNPGAWLILRPGQNTWKPWGRLEAWKESTGDHLGYRFELLPDGATAGLDPITLSNSMISFKNGGKFTIDIGNGSSPVTTPTGSFDSGSGFGSGSGSDLWSGSWAQLMYHGFVMSSKVAGKGRCSKPEVEIGVHHVTCTEDAAAFVALAAAVDLSVDACQSFSQKLRKELRQDGE